MRKILALILASFLLASPALAQKSKLQLDSDIDTMFPDNTVGAITPGKLRTVTKDIVASYVDWLSCTGTGGMVYWTGGTPTCLPPGTPGQILVMTGGIPTWAAAPFTIVGGAGISVDLIGTEYTISCTTFTSLNLGCVPASGGGTVNFLRADGSFTTISLSTSVTGTLQAAQFPALTGDVTTSAGSLATTLATVNGSPGTYGSSTAIPAVTVNGKGLVTGVTTNAVVAPAGTLTGTSLPNTVVTSFLTSVGALAGGSATTGFTINASNVTWTGTVPPGNLPVVGDASGSVSPTFGVMKCDGTTVVCSSGTITAIGGAATSVSIGTTTVAAGTNSRILYDNAGLLGEYAISGSGNVAMTTSPAFTTPNIGAATATSINGLTVTGSTGTLTVANGKTLTANNSIALSGTDSTTMTFPSSSASVAALDLASQTLSGGANVTSQSLTTGSITVNCGNRPLQYITGSTSAWTITAPANDGSCILLLTNAASSAVIPSFSGFTVSSGAGAALTTTGSAKFYISIFRINGTSGYQVTAAQ